MCIDLAILYKELEHPQILVSSGFLEPVFLGYCWAIEVFVESEVICGFLTVWGSAPSSHVVQGQLYKNRACKMCLL